MEPDRQMEIQLGHMCNNRCVFCVSGQRTERREAFPLAVDPIRERIREGFERGARRLTILGGEPTIQPGFLDALRHAVSLGFEEIVVFTNGAKTARPEFVDEILATGGNITFRFSFQGGNAQAHERTTKKLGSFGRLLQSMKNARARGRRITVNMCVVRSNFESVADFPALLLPHGAAQLHLDMVRPLDAGDRSDEELRAMMPRFTEMAPHLRAMVAGFPEGFDVNIGNFPYCAAPDLAHVIHHDGEPTLTVAVDDRDALSQAWDKYAVKARDKVKAPGCARCVFDDRCSGVYDKYRQFHGLDELVPVSAERLRELDPALRLFTLHLRPLLARLEGWVPEGGAGPVRVSVDSRERRVLVSLPLAGGAGEVVAALRPPETPGGVARTDRFTLQLLDAPAPGAATVALLRALLARLSESGGATVLHPVGDDAGLLSAAPRKLAALPGAEGWIDPRLALRLRTLRERAPFGALRWRDVRVSSGREAALRLHDPEGAEVEVTLSLRGAQVAGGYRLASPDAPPSPALVDGLRALMGALR